MERINRGPGQQENRHGHDVADDQFGTGSGRKGFISYSLIFLFFSLLIRPFDFLPNSSHTYVR